MSTWVLSLLRRPRPTGVHPVRYRNDVDRAPGSTVACQQDPQGPRLDRNELTLTSDERAGHIMNNINEPAEELSRPGKDVEDIVWCIDPDGSMTEPERQHEIALKQDRWIAIHQAYAAKPARAR